LTDSKTLPHKNTQNVITVPVDPKEVRVSGLMCYMDCLLTIIYKHLQKSKHYRQGRSWRGGGVLRLPREAESKGRQNGGKKNILNKKLIFCKKFNS
jgi:anaerobic ribonucleoside-triphosphate reductase